MIAHTIPTLSASPWTQGFTYDSQLDYLATASYGDGLPNASPSWSYDACRIARKADASCAKSGHPLRFKRTRIAE